MKPFLSNKIILGPSIKLVEKNELLQNDQEITNELSTFFKNTILNPCIINQISDDILEPVEKCINKHQFHPSILLTKNRIKIQNLFSLYAIERNNVISEFLNIDPKSNYWEQHPI